MSETNAPLVDNDGTVRLRRFAFATGVSAILITGVVAVVLGLTAPVGTWPAAVGLGAMVGFWMSPLLGALIGNGYHEIMHDRAQRAATEPVARPVEPAAGAVPLPAAG